MTHELGIETPANHTSSAKPHWRLRRRHWRAMRHYAALGMMFLACFGMLAQQTYAAYFIEYRIVHGPQPNREYIAFRPSAVAQIGESASRAARWLREAVVEMAEPHGRAVEPARPAGMPRPWQASDPVAPFTGVNLGNGNLYTAVPVVSWDTVSFSMYHNSLEASGVETLSAGWSHSYSARLDIAGDQVTYTADDGGKVLFAGEFDEGVDNRIYRLTLHVEHHGEYDIWVLTDDAMNTMTFSADGKLQQVADAGGNVTKLIYGAGRIETVVDSIGRELLFAYTPEGKLASVEAPPIVNERCDGEDVKTPRVFEFGYTPEGVLSAIHSPRREPPISQIPLIPGPLLGYRVDITYDDDGNIESITDYEENTSWIHYDPDTGEVTQVDHPEVYDFILDGPVITSRGYTAIVDEDSGFRLVQVTDERGGVMEYMFDPAGRLRRISDQLGRRIAKNTWTDLNRPATMVNVLGGVTTFEYDDKGDPLSTTTPRGTTFTDFDDLHRLTQITDPVGNAVVYAYEDDDNQTRITSMGGLDPENASRSKFRWGLSHERAN